MADDIEADNEIIMCWCGARGTFDQLFDQSVFLNGGCGGTGTLQCECGGDICVCHNHGEVECPGCPDCEHEDEWDYDPAEWYDDSP